MVKDFTNAWTFPSITSEPGTQKLYMKLRLSETVNKLNIEHRTPNIEHPILMALRLIYIKANEPQYFEG